ncbi:FtsX-like permease family protein [Kitasatospora sp. NPDC091207]|uniref:FtsX-like permease family protein n=1 Tax=Kitasatospora sp. NPDC091207 TaxID=3364083 RepID=UPI003808690D
MSWVGGLIRHRGGRLLATALGIALAVALIAALGAFLTGSKATMTARAAATVAVDWQVEVKPGADPAQALDTVKATPGVRAAHSVQFARTTGLTATTAGTTQSTGPGVVLALPDGYQAAFPREIRTLAGTQSGVLIAQQTAANLHVAPGDTVTVNLPAAPPAAVTIAAVVDLPQANSLFQTVGAPPQSQPTAPPDNVILLPAADFTTATAPLRAADPGAVTTQIHVSRNAPLPHDPAAAYSTVTAAAHQLEAKLAGAGQVGDNLAASLDGARQDALYAQVLFLFLGLPGAVVAALLTAAVTGAGAGRRRDEQALLRTRGLRTRQVAGLAAAEAALVGVTGGLLGTGIAAVAGCLAFGTASFGTTAGSAAAWSAAALAVGLLIAAAAVLTPALRALRSTTVAQARRSVSRARNPRWMRYGLDFVLLAASLLVFRASSGNNYALVLAPEGVAAISVSYWAFLGPALLWAGSALLLWRLAALALTHGRRPIARLVRPLTGTMATTTAAGMSRQRGPLVRSMVLLALALSFAASTAVFNATYRQQAETDAQLTNGADVTVTQPPGSTTGPDGAHPLAQIPGVRHVEPLQHRFAYIGSDLQDLFGIQPATIASATTLPDAYFSGAGAKTLLAELGARPDSLLVSAETVKDFQLAPGDQVNLRLPDSRTNTPRTVTFHYAGIVKEFPTAPKDSFFVANADYIAAATGSNAVGAFLIDTGGTHQSAVADRLRHHLGTSATVTDITQARSTVGSSLTSVDLAGLTRIELTFAVILAAGAGGIVLALGLAERRRTFAIASVLGATRRQLRGLVLAEAAALTTAGLAGGALISLALSHMLTTVLTGVFDPPPATLAIPWPYLALTALAATGAITAAALGAVRRSSRPPVEELRQP